MLKCRWKLYMWGVDKSWQVLLVHTIFIFIRVAFFSVRNCVNNQTVSAGIRTWSWTFLTNCGNHSSAVVRSRIGSLCSKPRDRDRWKVCCRVPPHIHHLDAGCMGCRIQESSRGRRLYAALVPTGHLLDAVYKRHSYPQVISRVPPISGTRSERVSVPNVSFKHHRCAVRYSKCIFGLLPVIVCK